MANIPSWTTPRPTFRQNLNVYGLWLEDDEDPPDDNHGDYDLQL